jgi:diguanylate cyclase (GGDEF)-like protein
MPLRARKIPLWFIWVVPFVLQIFAVVGVVAHLSLTNGERAVSDLAEQLIDKTGQQVDDHLDAYLALPQQLTEMNLRAIASGDLDITDRQASERYFWQQSKTFPRIGYLGYALTDGTEVGAGRWVRGLDVLFYENLPGPNNASDYLVDPQGKRLRLLQTYNYDPTQQSWYRDVVAKGRLSWSDMEIIDYDDPQADLTDKSLTSPPVRPTSIEPYMAIGTDAPIYDRKGRLLGVLSTDITLTQISEFLRKLKLSRTGQVFIVEHNQTGFLIGNSTQDPMTYRQNGGLQRYHLTNSSNPLVRALAPHLKSRMVRALPHQPQQFKLDINQQSYYVQFRRWRNPENGLDWGVVVIVPASDFMGTIAANTRQTIILCLGALGLTTVLGLLTARWVASPMRDLQRASQSLAAGNFSQDIAKSSILELDAVRQSFNQMATQLHASFAQMEYAATRDALTGLYNRAALRQRLAELLLQAANADPSHRSFAILFLDLDFFKLVNDSLGHLAGDQLLIAASQRLRTCVNTQNILARLGGDEFVILLESPEDAQQVIAIAEHIIHEFKAPFEFDQKIAFVSTSIGIVWHTSQTTDADSLLRNADIALYQAKANGKATYVVFDDNMHTAVLDRLHLETDLRHILNQSEKTNTQTPFPLQLHYQPIVDTHTLDIIGAEALIRWHHPTLGMISPAKFIPVAEETGLIIPLGYWIFEQACQQIYQWQQQIAAGQLFELSVNLSSRQFLQPDIVTKITQILAETGADPSFLKLEITESLLLQDRALVQDSLRQLQALGIQISLDDFGTGYSSLSYLHHFPLDTLKVDRSFIHQMTTDPQSLAVVESITALAHRLGMNVVAEGVETPTQLEYLRHIAPCEQIQGFLISPAVPAAQMTQWLGNRGIFNAQDPECNPSAEINSTIS